MPKLKQIKSILILLPSFFAWTTFQLLIKSLTINDYFAKLFVLDSKSYSAILPSLTPCSSCLLNITSILLPN